MDWQRWLLGIAILAMTVTIFVPLPLWAAATLMTISLLAAILVLVGMALSGRR